MISRIVSFAMIFPYIQFFPLYLPMSILGSKCSSLCAAVPAKRSTPATSAKKAAKQTKKKGGRLASTSHGATEENKDVSHTAEDTKEGNESDAEEDDKSYWLMKAEPESRLEKGVDVKFSIDDLREAKEPEPWDGKLNVVVIRDRC